jgi:large subunit ribosomal protein L10
MKIGLVIKQESERTLREKLKDVDSFLLIKYSGLSASDLNLLRNSLIETNSSLMVIKNCVGRRILKPYQDLFSQISGPCGLIFVNEDLISASRVVYKFIKAKPNLEVKAGFLKERIITEAELAALSKIPSLSALRSQLLGGLKFPIFSLAFSLKQILNKLVWVLEQIKDKK